jgi:hypothetical protein
MSVRHQNCGCHPPSTSSLQYLVSTWRRRVDRAKFPRWIQLLDESPGACNKKCQGYFRVCVWGGEGGWERPRAVFSKNHSQAPWLCTVPQVF